MPRPPSRGETGGGRTQPRDGTARELHPAPPARRTATGRRPRQRLAHAAWALATRDWSPELGQLFGIDVGLLPKAVTSRYAYGTLTTPAGPVPLTVCTGDQSAVPFAPGPLDPACAYVNVGTGGFVQRAVRGQLPDAPRLLVSVVWSEDEVVDYMLEGTVNGAGSALDWFARNRDRSVTAAAATGRDESGRRNTCSSSTASPASVRRGGSATSRAASSATATKWRSSRPSSKAWPSC